MLKLDGKFLLKRGGMKLINEETELTLVFENTSCSMLSFTDSSMELTAESKEFRVDMSKESKISLIEKIDEAETFWKMEYFKHPPEAESEYNLNITVNPIKIIYEGAFINEIVYQSLINKFEDGLLLVG